MQMPHSAVMRSEISSARPRMISAVAVQDPVAVVARERRPVGPGDREGAADVVDGRLGHRADERAGVRIAHVDRARAADVLAGDAHLLAQHVRRGGGPASSVIMFIAARPRHCRWLSARSNASKLRQRRPGGRASARAVGDQRHLLLGDAAVRAQRRVEAREVVPVAAGADHREPLGDDDEVADAIRRAARSARRPRRAAARARCRAARRCARAASATATGDDR